MESDWFIWPVVFGIIGLLIGAQKGRVLAGGLWGFFLGPLGLLVVGLGPNMKPKCPKCFGVIEPMASKCKNCGSDLGDLKYRKH